MSDFIDRQAVINTLDSGAELLRRVLDITDIVGAEREKYKWGLELIESYISDMKGLPSAEPKRGKWIKFGNHPNEDWMNVRCSECVKTMAYNIHTEIRPNYCPNCGARMEGKE